jgi:hypothetical protein
LAPIYAIFPRQSSVESAASWLYAARCGLLGRFSLLAAAALRVHASSQIARTRSDFERFSEMSENFETGRWMMQSGANQSLKGDIPCYVGKNREFRDFYAHLTLT